MNSEYNNSVRKNYNKKTKKSMRFNRINLPSILRSILSMVVCAVIMIGANQLNAQCERRAMACNNLLNIPLNENCEAIITIDMILEDQQGPDSDYELRIFDPQGNRIMSDTLREDYDCEPLKVEVECLASEIYCWGYIVIEDKIKPSLTISPLDTAVTCNVYDFNLDPNALVTEVSFSDQGSCEKPDSLGIVDIRVTPIGNCSDTVEIIQRYWSVVDKSKFANDSTVIQTIYVLRAEFSDFEYPRDTIINCEDVGDISVEALGEPELKSCKDYFDILFSETEFPGVCGAARKISRQWTILDPCRNVDTVIFQTIEVVDNEDPNLDFSAFDIPEDRFETSKEECTASARDIANPIITDCSIIDASQVRAWYQFVDASGVPFGLRYSATVNSMETFDLIDVPVGQEFIVIFEAIDSCGNINTGMSQPFTAADTSDPNTVCESSTVVAITSSGLTEVTAESLDDHSYDNCGIVRKEIRRLDSNCIGFQSDRTLGNSVHFCCEDVANNPIRVLLRVYDAYDNSSDCIIDVIVQDKREPVITCPSERTFNCDVDINEIPTMLRSSLPQVTWMCGEGTIDVEVPEFQLTECGSASFSVVWTATDANGAQSTCTQTVIIDDTTPATINPPSRDEYELFGCSGGTDPVNIPGSAPTVTGVDCENIAITYEDLPFNTIDDPDNPCQKIQRVWTIIDWCALETGTLADATIGTFEQIIKIFDNVAPTITTTIEDFEVSDNDVDCEELVSIIINATDDCTPVEELDYTYELDMDGDGVADVDGETNEFSAVLDAGTYSIVFKVTDKCGNTSSTDTINFEVTTTKSPIPLLEGAFSISLQTNGSATLVASDLNVKSTQGCSDSEEGLIFSFSTDPSVLTRTFTCADIPNGVSQEITVPVYVIDERGNINSTTVPITVTDAPDVCPDNVAMVAIRGSVMDENLRGVANIAVSSFHAATNTNQTVMTDENGNYTLTDLESFRDYSVVPSLEGFDLTGVTTLDLVLIQRHILGLAPLDSPYKVIAADINNSESLAASDLAELRKLILGIRSTLGQNNSWKFISREYAFDDMLSPWDYPSEAVVNNVISDVSSLDFIGLKVGDVNGNAFGALAQEMAGTRSVKDMTYTMNNEGAKVTYTIRPGFDMTAVGMQLALDFDSNLELEEVIGWNIQAEHYVVENNSLKISWTNANGIIADENTVIKLVFNNKGSRELSLKMNNQLLQGEIYNESLETSDLNLSKEADNLILNNSLFVNQNVPNPFNAKTFIDFDLPMEDNVQLTVTDLNGKVVYSSKSNYAKGKNRIVIDAADIPGGGVYHYTLTTSTSQDTKRMIIIY